MFQLTRESDYAIRVMVFLAGRPSEVVSCKAIARAQRIPRSFLQKILQQLMRAKLLRSLRGAGGGFQLAVDPAETSLFDLVGTFEKNLGLNRCVIPGHDCELEPVCVVHDVWSDAWTKVVNTLESVTLADLVERAKKGSQSDSAGEPAQRRR